MKNILVVLFFLSSAFAQWQEQNSGTDAQLRGISAVSATVAWASGANGTILRTVDGGTTWTRLNIEGADKLDFRDIRGFDAQTAYVLSIGPGESSRIYKTTDGGTHWRLQFINHNPKAFYDCFAFWDRNHGMVVSDSVEGRFPLLAIEDGERWTPLQPQTIPAAQLNEGLFAASGTCITTNGSKDVWFATGGPVARVFHSSDRGSHWSAAATPILSGMPPQGIFSIAFRDSKHGVIVGGDYTHAEKAERNAAYTQDGGATWHLSAQMPSGYRSAVAFISPALIIAVGTTGADVSEDGAAWKSFSAGDFNAASFAGGSGWAVGPHGRIGHAEFNDSPGH